MADLRTRLLDHDLASPFVLASGPLSSDAGSIWRAFRAGAGAVTTKTLRLAPAVNPTPHIVIPRSQQLRTSLLNSEEWSDLRWEQWLQSELPQLRDHPGLLIVSLGHTAPEGRVIAAAVSRQPAVDAFECVAYEAAALAPLVRAVREQTALPILAKLSFNWGGELWPTAEAAIEAGATGFTAIDSLGPALSIDVDSHQPLIGGAGNRAWLSGAAIRPLAQAIVAELVTRFARPVIGTGGVWTVEDAVEMTLLGASAVGVCTAPLLRGLTWFERTNAKLTQWLDVHDLLSLDALRGAVLRRLHPTGEAVPLEFLFDPLHCTRCDLCVDLCPYQARTISGPRPRSPDIALTLDRERCRSCGLCVELCKPAALRYANWPRAPEAVS